MLGAGVRATGEVNIDGLIQRQFFVEIIGQRERVTFGVGLRKLAIGIASASDEAIANMRFFSFKTDFAQSFASRFNVGVGDVWDDEILPYREPNFAGAVQVGDFGNTNELFRSNLANGNGDADVIEAGLLLRVNAAVGV